MTKLGDHTLLIKRSNSRGDTALLVHVVDIIMTRNDEKEIQCLKQCLAKEFEIKELEKLNYFLGFEIAHSRKGVFISQQKYVADLLNQMGKLACRSASTRKDPNHKLG